jgi:Tol biopolymer transport system component
VAARLDPLADLVSQAPAPDGAWIAFSAGGSAFDAGGRCLSTTPLGLLIGPGVAQAHSIPKEAWRVGRDGSGLTRLTSLCLDDPSLAWSPDGRWIAAYGGAGLVLVRADGSLARSVSPDGGYGGVDWAR